MSLSEPERKEIGSDKIYLIRPATIEDVHACVNAFSLLLDEIEDFSENDLQNSQDNVRLFYELLNLSIRDGVEPIIATLDGNQVGFFLCLKMFGFQTKINIIHAIGSYVYPSHRKKGLSERMCQFGFEHYKSLGVNKIFGKVLDNQKSKEVNLRLGLEQINISCKTL